MHRGERELSGLCNGEGRLDGLQVPHFADQHHVGILAQGVFQRRAEGLGEDREGAARSIVEVPLRLGDEPARIGIDVDGGERRQKRRGKESASSASGEMSR